MFVLLKHLQRVRAEIGAERPDVRGSLALRHVDAGSCNGCEHELAATAGPHYDLQKYGLNIVASPRHADVLLVTGAVTTQMVDHLLAAYEAMSEPRMVAALGDCALGCNVLGTSSAFSTPLRELLPVTIEIPGCPPTPATIAKYLCDAIEDWRALVTSGSAMERRS